MPFLRACIAQVSTSRLGLRPEPQCSGATWLQLIVLLVSMASLHRMSRMQAMTSIWSGALAVHGARPRGNLSAAGHRFPRR